MGAAEYGMYFSLFSFAFLFNSFLDFGITNYNNRHIARHRHLLDKYLPNFLVLKLLFSVFYVAVSLLFALIIGYDKTQLYIVSLLIINQLISSFLLFIRSNLNALQLFKTDSFLSVLDRSLLIIFCGILLWASGKPFQIEWLIYSQTASLSISLLVALLFLAQHARVFRFSFKRNLLYSILRKSSPYALLVLLMSLYSRLDSVLLDRLLENGSFYAGIFAQSFRIFETFSMFAFLFASLLLPIFSNMLKKKESISDLTQFSALLLLSPTVVLSAIGFLYKELIISFLYTNHTEISAQVFGILSLSFVPVAAGYIFGTLLTANGNIHLLNKLSVAILLINLGLNLLLIPHFQAYGAAWANFISLSAMAFGQYFYAVRKFSFNNKYFYLFLLYIVSVAGISAIISVLVENSVQGIALIVVFGIILAFLLKFIRPRMIIAMFRN